jgi:hypothetical protein
MSPCCSSYHCLSQSARASDVSSIVYKFDVQPTVGERSGMHGHQSPELDRHPPSGMRGVPAATLLRGGSASGANQASFSAARHMAAAGGMKMSYGFASAPAFAAPTPSMSPPPPTMPARPINTDACGAGSTGGLTEGGDSTSENGMTESTGVCDGAPSSKSKRLKARRKKRL